jgi:ribose 5-phosphate isomerase B
VRADEGSLGIVLGGSGNGEQIAANKVMGIRAALAWSTDTARLAREHNDAQVVSIGARMHSIDEATAIVDTFLDSSFSRDPRHERRLAMVIRYEDHEELPPIVGSEG